MINLTSQLSRYPKIIRMIKMNKNNIINRLLGFTKASEFYLCVFYINAYFDTFNPIIFHIYALYLCPI